MLSQSAKWSQLTAQQLVRYEALFALLDDIQMLEDIDAIARQVAGQWKYFASVTSWRLVVPRGDGYEVIDGARGEARRRHVTVLDDWDDHHWRTQRPSTLNADTRVAEPPPPTHLLHKTEILVLPFLRGGECIGVLSAATRHESFNELDRKFIRLFGGHLADRLADIILREQATAALIARATRDALTGALNRGAIIDRLRAELDAARRDGRSLGVVLGDVDFFKVINDAHGHLAGDQVLSEVARRLGAAVRDCDLMGRYGGEEFLMVLPGMTHASLLAAAERLRLAVGAEPVLVGPAEGPAVTVTISLGTASTGPGDNSSLQELLKRADDALYHSKATGRNRVTSGCGG